MDPIAALLPSPAPFTLDPLAGDAGNRRYFRVRQGNSYILMQLADPEGFKQSEEAVTGEVAIDELPFLNLQRYLAAAGIPVPELIATDMAAGLVLLEDLGDLSLMQSIDGAPREEIAAHYRAAIDILLRLQRGTPLDNGCVAAHRDYTEALLLWEFDHYVEYGIEALRGASLPAATRNELGARFAALARRIARQPPVLVHRDYHSRNIMVRPDGSLSLIDFQDALMGPPTYDLASLLWDPYVTLPEGLAGELTSYFLSQDPEAKRDGFEPLLALTALQRLFKAAGRFVYIDRVKGNPGFLADIPACLARSATILAEVPELADLRDILVELEPRLAG